MSTYEDFLSAIENGAVGDLQDLLRNKEVWRLENYEKNDLSYPMQTAIDGCGHDKITPVFQLLVQNKFQFDEPNAYGWRPIVAAIRYGNVNAARLLIENGASIEWYTNDEYNWASAVSSLPFMPVSDGDFETMLDLLIEYGANLNPARGVPPLHGAILSASRTGASICNTRIESLISRGANINHRGAIGPGLMPLPYHGGPLHAYYASSRQVVEKLLELGADTNITDSSGRNAEAFFVAYRDKAESEREELDAILAMIRKTSGVHANARPVSPSTNKGRATSLLGRLFGQ